MKILINQPSHELPEGATVADAMAAMAGAAALRCRGQHRFVPNTRYAAHAAAGRATG
jgi:sulfur carrier protein